MDLEGEDVWVTQPLSRKNVLHKTLHDMDASLRCQICGDLFCNPVSLNECQHTFCSHCIRASLTEQSGRVRQGGPTCPSCRKPLKDRRYENNYRPNRTLEHAVTVFQRLREPLHAVMVQVATNGPVTAAASESPKKAGGQSPSNDSTSSSSASSTTSSRARRGIKRTSDDEQKGEPVVLEEKRRRIYSVFKNKKQLQDLCAEEGISTSGTEQELKNRHERFINFWNAHRDTLNGCSKTGAAIVKEFNEQETARIRQAAKNQRQRVALDSLYQEAAGNGSAGVGDSDFKAKVNSNFKDLIAQVRQRKKQKQESSESAHGPESSPESKRQSPPSKQPSPAASLNEKNPSIPSEPPQKQSPPGVLLASETRESPTAAATPAHEFGNATPNQKSTRTSPASSGSQDKARMANNSSIHPKRDSRSASLQETVVLVDEEEAPSKPKRATRPPPRERPMAQPGSLVGPWKCPRCTFLNQVNTWSRACCEMCELARPKPNAPTTTNVC